MSVRILVGDCLDVLPTFVAESFDAIVTDPPYGLKFMGRAWDHGVPGVEFWIEALRVAKPGAHLVAFGGTRTFHRLTCAIEDAGWEIRDCLSWLYGSGFPKSLDVSKAMDKAAGIWRGRCGAVTIAEQPSKGREYERTEKGEAATPAGMEWQGWGTALKPAWEPIILARKPLISTVTANVLAHGTGALNIDACRIEAHDSQLAEKYASVQNAGPRANNIYGNDSRDRAGAAPHDAGRWPANVVLDEDAAAALDEQGGDVGGGDNRGFRGGRGSGFGNVGAGVSHDSNPCGALYADTGGASRFFYTAKASRSERNFGLESQADHIKAMSGGAAAAATRGESYDIGDGGFNRTHTVKNHHPTVKPVDLMRWLVRLVTPPHGHVLDPFTGSGSTGVACIAEAFSFTGIEKVPDYVAIAQARLDAAQPSLFSDTDTA